MRMAAGKSFLQRQADVTEAVAVSNGRPRYLRFSARVFLVRPPNNNKKCGEREREREREKLRAKPNGRSWTLSLGGCSLPFPPSSFASDPGISFMVRLFCFGFEVNTGCCCFLPRPFLLVVSFSGFQSTRWLLLASRYCCFFFY